MKKKSLENYQFIYEIRFVQVCLAPINALVAGQMSRNAGSEVTDFNFLGIHETPEIA